MITPNHDHHAAAALRSFAAAHLDGEAATAARNIVYVLALRAGCWIDLRDLEIDAMLLAMADRLDPPKPSLSTIK